MFGGFGVIGMTRAFIVSHQSQLGKCVPYIIIELEKIKFGNVKEFRLPCCRSIPYFSSLSRLSEKPRQVLPPRHPD